MADAMMKPLGEANGVKWYWAEPGRFEKPGVYYWNGSNNVLCVPYRAAPGAPAVAQVPPNANGYLDPTSSLDNQQVASLEGKLLLAGQQGRLQWLGYWKPNENEPNPPESAWTTVLPCEARGMLHTHGVYRFRVKPAPEAPAQAAQSAGEVERSAQKLLARFDELLNRYWSLGYAEGKEGRDHDTEGGDAQITLCELHDLFRAALSHKEPQR